jgi:hypothetical protein
LERIADAAALATKNGIEPHAGHGLTYDNVAAVAAIPQLAELNIGHFLIGDAIFTGIGRGGARDAPVHGRGPRMIIGLGSDLCNIDRIGKSLDRFGERFIARVFTDVERAKGGKAAVHAGRHLRQALRRQGGVQQGGGHRLSRRRVHARYRCGE